MNRLDYLRYLIQIALFGMMVGCAPVYQYWTPTSISADSADLAEGHYHQIKSNETLHLIAWIYDRDYLEIAAWNNLEEPYTIYTGQQLRVYPPPEERQLAEREQEPDEQLALVQPDKAEVLSPPKFTGWHWPTKGKLLCRFAQDECKNGLNIAGTIGQPVYAAASGEVVYSGHGIKYYQSLILIKHPNNYISAYAHNKDMLVKIGDIVTARQQIANMGIDTLQRPTLFFQIRKDGTPVDPHKLFSEQNV